MKGDLPEGAPEERPTALDVERVIVESKAPAAAAAGDHAAVRAVDAAAVARGRADPQVYTSSVVERSYDAYAKRARSPWRARLLTALVVAPAVWLAGALAAVAGGSLGVRWLAAALVWPLVPVALLVLVSPRLGHRRVSLTIALVGVASVALFWRPALVEAVTVHATWMLPADGGPAPTSTDLSEASEASGASEAQASEASGASEAQASEGSGASEAQASEVDGLTPPELRPSTPPTDELPPGSEPPARAKGCFRQEIVETGHSDSAYGTILADMDGDGVLDAVWVDSGAEPQIRVAAGDRSGGFKPVSAVDYDGGGLSLAVADFDHDGNLDGATADYERAKVTLWMGEGDGSLSRGDSFKTFRKPLAVTSADLDGDGHGDLIVSHYFHVEVMRGSASGKLRTAPWLRLVKDPDNAKRLLTPEDIVAVDLTADGLMDLVIPKGDVTSVEVWTGLGRGRFRRSADVESCYGSSHTVVGDFYEDGHPDVLIGCASNYELFVGDGTGGLERRGNVGPDNAYHQAEAADMNGDGHLDLLIPTIPGGIGSRGFGERSGRLVLLLGDGKGRFTEEDAIEVAGLQHRIVAITDIDGDERLDAVYECFGQRPGAHIGVVLGTGCAGSEPAPPGG